MSLSKIMEGWKNHIAPAAYLEEEIKRVSQERLAICRACSFHRNAFEDSIRPDEHCGNCGCSLLPKTKCLSCNCPEDKWLPLLTADEQKTINDETTI